MFTVPLKLQTNNEDTTRKKSSSHGPLEFCGSLREFQKPIQVRLKTVSLLELLLLLIPFILHLLPLILSTSRYSSSSTLTWGSLRDCLAPVAPHLSDLIEGSPPCCTVSTRVPSGPMRIHLPVVL